MEGSRIGQTGLVAHLKRYEESAQGIAREMDAARRKIAKIWICNNDELL